VCIFSQKKKKKKGGGEVRRGQRRGRYRKVPPQKIGGDPNNNVPEGKGKRGGRRGEGKERGFESLFKKPPLKCDVKIRNAKKGKGKKRGEGKKKGARNPLHGTYS